MYSLHHKTCRYLDCYFWLMKDYCEGNIIHGSLCNHSSYVLGSMVQLSIQYFSIVAFQVTFFYLCFSWRVLKMFFCSFVFLLQGGQQRSLKPWKVPEMPWNGFNPWKKTWIPLKSQGAPENFWKIPANLFFLFILGCKLGYFFERSGVRLRR